MRLDAQELRVGYGAVPVLHGITLGVETGEIVAVVGRNGVGKTTLVKALMGTLPASSGSVTMNGTDITTWAPSRRVRAGLRATYQERALFQNLTVGDNLRLNGFTTDQYDAILETFPSSLPGRVDQKAGTLSGGEQKMLASACALQSNAALVVMDEPTEGLQPSNVDLLGTHIDVARAAGRGVILIEQHIALAKRLADRFIVLEKGEVVESGTANDPDLQTRIARRLVI